ncbi:MAG: hypothetical protein F6K22_29125, partial [Okeania sp. SIO2F4]|nr:hypothetical protein [Okeania sp. SIO2F4]
MDSENFRPHAYRATINSFSEALNLQRWVGKISDPMRIEQELNSFSEAPRQ